MKLFLKAVSEVLEVDGITPGTEFRQTEGWCSLKAFGLLVMMENDWGTPLAMDRFGELRTVRDLFREAVFSLAAEVFGVPRSSICGDTRYKSIPEWDSVAHLKLAMEAERRFGMSYDIERIPRMETLEDFMA